MLKMWKRNWRQCVTLPGCGRDQGLRVWVEAKQIQGSQQAHCVPHKVLSDSSCSTREQQNWEQCASVFYRSIKTVSETALHR